MFVAKKIKYLFFTLADVCDFLFFIILNHRQIKNKLKNKKRPIWLFSERGKDAKDNAFVLFEYVIKNYKDIDAFYVIDFKSPDIDRVSKLKNIFDYKSKEHKISFLLADVLVSAYFRGSIEPWRQRVFKFIYKKYFDKKYVFVQHGITKDDMSDMFSKQKEYYDLFICGAKPEYEYLLKTLGYSKKEIVYTGFARYDKLYNFKTKKQILLMPTWRRYIVDILEKTNKKNKSVFIRSEYFKKYNSLLNNGKLEEILSKNNLDLVFFQHTEFQKYNDCFVSNSNNIKIANRENYDVQTLLKESKLLITDYSSVFFDFAYMKKPMLFFQFDEKEFFVKHHKKGYFDYRKNGFGEVIVEEIELINSIQEIIENNFKMEKEYGKRIEKFFPLYDQQNCKRIVKQIKNL